MKNMRNPVIMVVSLTLVTLFFAGVSAFTEHQPKHFVLVHGAGLGAWSWYKLVPSLQSYGHNVTALDLGASGINLLRVNEIRTFSDYSKPVLDFMESIPPTRKVILVGHSMGGTVISQAMELFPQKISVAVFLTAAMPGPSLPFSVIAQKAVKEFGLSLDNKLYYDNGPNNPPTSLVFGPKYISQELYQYSPHEDVALAIMLVRPVPFTSAEELVFTEANYGSVKRVLILSEKDHIWPKQFQEWMIKKNPPTRVELIKDSDHMVMISQPAQLLTSLLGIARDFS